MHGNVAYPPRMRRHDPDGLTPREREVLDLLKRGYSNRDIAQELQISLSGAKYHVSEIMSRLGATSRDEAVELSATSRRWGFAPLSLGGLRLGLPPLFGSKLATACAVVIGIAGLGLGGVLLAGTAGGPESAMEPTEEDSCARIPQCSPISQVEYATIEEAAVHASFLPMIPAYIPDGFTQHQVFAKERDYSNPYVPEVHNDWVTVTYRNDEGGRLVISQGFPAWINARHAFPGSESETLDVGGRQALWSTMAPIAFPRFNPETDLHGVLTLFLGNFASGWGGEGSWFSGSPMEYSIASDSLGLQELILIAESVTFPEILEPNEGYEPESFFE
jgi:DNA-binding CsgD family transcriptional regulator